MSNSNNKNSNNFILGVNPNNNYIKPSNTLINHIKNLENISRNNIKNNREKMSNVVNDLIKKLEKEVVTLNNQIKNFNVEKKTNCGNE